MSKSGKRTSWQERVISVATEQTREESLGLWGRLSDEEPPFNYRLEHLKAVVRIAEGLALKLGADLQIVRAAAWLHDLAKEGIAELVENGHGVEGAEEARKILERTDFPKEKIDAVCQAIAEHVGLYRDHPVEPLEAAILWDADKLAKLGAISLVHFLCLSPSLGQGTTESLLAEGRRWLRLQAKMVESMNTPLGKELGWERYEVVRGFYEQLERELKGG
ncbi:MAG TPA: hypothetical protein DCP08_04625 [Chloroflexi bacterium]|nr:hypothetical protein [Chloroflexota bacterium]